MDKCKNVKHSWVKWCTLIFFIFVLLFNCSFYFMKYDYEKGLLSPNWATTQTVDKELLVENIYAGLH